MYAYEDAAEDDDEHLLHDDDQLNELEEDLYARRPSRSRSRSRSDSRSRSLSRSRTQSLSRSHAMSRSPYNRAVMPVAQPYDDLELDYEERPRNMYNPRRHGHRHGHRHRHHTHHHRHHHHRQHVQDDALYDEDLAHNSNINYMPRKYYDDLDIAPWATPHPFWPTSRRPLPQLPAASPNLSYPTPHAFAVQLGSLSGASGPWLSVMDELDHHRLLFATGACTAGISVVTLADEITGELLRLTSCRTGRAMGCADVRIVVTNRFGAPLVTAVVPAVTDSCERPYSNPTLQSYYGGYGGGYGGRYNGAYRGYGGYASPMGMATPWVNSHGRGYDADAYYGCGGGMSPYMGMYGVNDSSLGAIFYMGDRGHEGPTMSRSRKRSAPVMRLVRSPDGVREWLQTEYGEELASVVYSTAPGTPAPFAMEGSRHRIVVRAGVDVAMVAAALACRLWIYVETGIGQ